MKYVKKEAKLAPTAKAKKLVESFTTITNRYTPNGYKRVNIALALKCVEEILKSNPSELKGFEYESTRNYWNQVKKALSNL